MRKGGEEEGTRRADRGGTMGERKGGGDRGKGMMERRMEGSRIS